jgi:hypothetical protein
VRGSLDDLPEGGAGSTTNPKNFILYGLLKGRAYLLGVLRRSHDDLPEGGAGSTTNISRLIAHGLSKELEDLLNVLK